MNATPNPRLCWLRLTPHRVLLALLPVWGALLLSVYFGWLGNGCPVLLALASLALSYPARRHFRVLAGGK